MNSIGYFLGEFLFQSFFMVSKGSLYCRLADCRMTEIF